MKNTPVWFVLSLAIASFVITPLVLPSQGLCIFAPFLAYFLIKNGLFPTLWFAASFGLLMDSLSSSTQLGIHALGYCVCVLIASVWRQYFYEEGLFSLPVYTGLFSCIWSLLFLIFGHFEWSFYSLVSNLLYSSLIDAVYAFFFLKCPLLIYSWARPQPKRYR